MRIFLFTTVFRTALRPNQPPIPWVEGAFFPGVKRQGREADHSPPPSAEIKNAWSYTFTPRYVFMAWCLLKLRDIFTFTFMDFYNQTFKSISCFSHAYPACFTLLDLII
jgi:hypothetical protein